MKLKFTKAETDIMNEIAMIQIESYNIILENNLLKEEELLLTQYSSSLGEAEREARWKITQYKELINNPVYVIFMEDIEISTMRHILFHIEGSYLTSTKEEQVAVRAIWEKFFFLEEQRNPVLAISKTIKIKQNEKRKEHIPA